MARLQSAMAPANHPLYGFFCSATTVVSLNRISRVELDGFSVVKQIAGHHNPFENTFVLPRFK